MMSLGVGVTVDIGQVIRTANTQEVDSDEIAGTDPNNDRLSGEKRSGYRAGQEAGDNQVIHGMGGQRSKSVDLLRDLHGSKFGGHRSTDTGREHQAGKDRPEFAAHADADHGPSRRLHLEFMELEKGLRTENHASRSASGHDHALRFHSDKIELVQDLPTGRGLVSQGEDSLIHQNGEFPQFAQKFAKMAAESG